MGFETTRYAKTRPGRRGGVRRGERWGRREPRAKQTRGVALLGPSRSRGSRSQRGLGRGRASVGGGRLFSSRERFGPRGRSVDLPPRPLRTRTTSALARGSSYSAAYLVSLRPHASVEPPVVPVVVPYNLKPSRRADLNRVFYTPSKKTRWWAQSHLHLEDFVFPVRKPCRAALLLSSWGRPRPRGCTMESPDVEEVSQVANGESQDLAGRAVPTTPPLSPLPHEPPPTRSGADPTTLYSILLPPSRWLARGKARSCERRRSSRRRSC